MERVTCNKCETQNKTNSKYCSNCGFELPKVITVQQDVVQEIKKQKKPNKPALIGIIAGIIVFSISYWGVQKVFFSTPVFDKQLMTIASELNKTCPIVIDAQTQLDNSIALPNNTFQYNYTLVAMEKYSVDTNEFKAYMKPIILEQVKTNPQMKLFRDNEVIINYLYRDKNKQYIALIAITPNMYK